MPLEHDQGGCKTGDYLIFPVLYERISSKDSMKANAKERSAGGSLGHSVLLQRGHDEFSS